MQSLDQQVIACALKWHRQGTTSGSAPCCIAGALRRARPRDAGGESAGEFCGSLSGGCIEDDFLARLQQGAFIRDSQLARYGEGGLDAQVRLPCGGVLEVLIEHLPADAATLTHLTLLHRALEGAIV